MADDYEDLSVEELQRRVAQLRSLQERIDQGRLDISDRPLLLELIAIGMKEEAERTEVSPEFLDLMNDCAAKAKQGVDGDAKPSKTSLKPKS